MAERAVAGLAESQRDFLVEKGWKVKAESRVPA